MAETEKMDTHYGEVVYSIGFPDRKLYFLSNHFIFVYIATKM